VVLALVLYLALRNLRLLLGASFFQGLEEEAILAMLATLLMGCLLAEAVEDF
jgi:hypothetical protein